MAIAGNGMQHDLQRLETISQNVANVLTPAYKRQMVVGSAFAAHMQGTLEQGAAAPSILPSSLTIDPSAGSLRYTANTQDVAIEGAAFFEVESRSGPQYTRQGALRVDVTGRLVGAHDLPLAGATGDIILTPEPFSIDANGDVRQGERITGRLKLVHFANPEALVPVGGGLYAQGNAHLAERDMSSKVRAGFQEASNVNSAQEMVRLTETVRHFEALQKIMQGYDDVLEKTIRKLGEF
ncbi:flagellar hook-basal body protein [Janthinobacterium sp. 64]|uniref:flagellar hook-basal body protein n=1 Tax=Janthinobacterium sp. 64 TaxID=2035208 RepID=UPI0022B7ED64|nr:flagellar hook basal-body protein [Janthinobacterium sp. 64]